MSYADAWLKWSHIIETGAAPLSAHMVELAKVRSASAVLDIGTGIGEPGISAARVLQYPGRVLAIDPDKKMIASAKDRALKQHVHNIDFEVASVETMKLDAQSFDTVLARWSLMFVSDPANSILRLRKALRPNGRLVAATWASPEKVPALSLAKTAVHKHFDLPGSPHETVRTFALSDEAEIASLFNEAGFSAVTIEPFAVTYEFSSLSEFIQYRIEVAGPLWSGMESGSSELLETAFRAIESALEPHKNSNGGYRLVNQAICIHCRA
jgi:ubiquinone/menaquinone biosynthesis C-methylase UbiE